MMAMRRVSSLESLESQMGAKTRATMMMGERIVIRMNDFF